jgi:hypothetical protein
MRKSASVDSKQNDGGYGNVGSRREFLRSVISAPLQAGLGSGLGWTGVTSAPPLTGRAGLLACE